MKKTYMQPLTKVVKVNAENMLTGSNYEKKGVMLTGSEGGLQRADKYDDFDSSDELW